MGIPEGMEVSVGADEDLLGNILHILQSRNARHHLAHNGGLTGADQLAEGVSISQERSANESNLHVIH